MKKNYFFKEIIAGTRLKNFSIQFCGLLLFTLLSCINTIHASIRDSANVVDQHDGIIYISKNALITVDSSSISGKIVYLTEKTKIPDLKPTQDSLFAKNALQKLKQETAKKIAKKLPLKINVLKTEKIQSSPVENRFYKDSSSRRICVFVSSNNTYNTHDSVFAEATVLPKILFLKQFAKQKYFTSLSYLQFGKFRSSSLRAPPYH